MSTYSTTTALQVLAVGYEFNTATTSLASKCILWAENEIDKKLRNRYNVAAFRTTVPPLINTLCEQLSLGYLYENMSRGSKESIGRAKIIIDRVMENLKELAEGSAAIADSTGAILPDSFASASVRSNTSDYTPTFGEDDPLNWAVDSDKLDDIDSSRD